MVDDILTRDNRAALSVTYGAGLRASEGLEIEVLPTYDICFMLK